MTSNFVRYSPGIERDDPNFEQSLQTVLEDMTRHMRASAQADGGGRVVRDAHAKGFGLARGEFEILSGLPAPYAQGIYSKSGRHEAMIRFSPAAGGLCRLDWPHIGRSTAAQPSNFIWQPPHFWFLARQYRNQYQQTRIPILPLTNGDRLTNCLIMLLSRIKPPGSCRGM